MCPVYVLPWCFHPPVLPSLFPLSDSPFFIFLRPHLEYFFYCLQTNFFLCPLFPSICSSFYHLFHFLSFHPYFNQLSSSILVPFSLLYCVLNASFCVLPICVLPTFFLVFSYFIVSIHPSLTPFILCSFYLLCSTIILQSFLHFVSSLHSLMLFLHPFVSSLSNFFLLLFPLTMFFVALFLCCLSFLISFLSNCLPLIFPLFHQLAMPFPVLVSTLIVPSSLIPFFHFFSLHPYFLLICPLFQHCPCSSFLSCVLLFFFFFLIICHFLSWSFLVACVLPSLYSFILSFSFYLQSFLHCCVHHVLYCLASLFTLFYPSVPFLLSLHPHFSLFLLCPCCLFNSFYSIYIPHAKPNKWTWRNRNWHNFLLVLFCYILDGIH